MYGVVPVLQNVMEVRGNDIDMHTAILFLLRCTHNSLEGWKVVDVKKRRAGRPVNLGDFNLDISIADHVPLTRRNLMTFSNPCGSFP